ncbi:type II secretion system protein GspF [Chromatiales bacterium (ex Bugula neritina AB1)]|nr:type II secretion system protein GspF [Chromatiales bacterium (ex Bugula neritina AB1)]
MPAYEYLALDTKGNEKKGVLEGDNPRQIRQQLRDLKLTPLEVNEGNAKSSKSKSPGHFRGGLSSNDLALVTRQIATLASSGTPIEEALSAVSRQSEKQKIKSLMLSVRSRVMEGKPLASALGEYPKVFPEIFQATVAAGEQSGHLDSVLERLADYTEDKESTKAIISKALYYPIGLVCIAFGIVTFLLAYVVPKVVQVFDSMNQELPLLTRIMISLSEFIKDWGLLVFIAFVALIIIWQRVLRNETVKMRVHAFMLKIPLLSRIIRGSNASQFARTLSILAASGVPVLDALGIASLVLTNRPMRQAVKTAATEVREGGGLSRSLERTGYFPPMMLHLIASGEASGRLETMLEKAATHQERELNSILAVFLALLEPVIILIMAGMVMLIVLAILLPIFELNQLVA